MRGLKQLVKNFQVCSTLSKNQNAPIEGIETWSTCALVVGEDANGKNQNAPIEGIETFENVFFVYSRFE